MLLVWKGEHSFFRLSPALLPLWGPTWDTEATREQPTWGTGSQGAALGLFVPKSWVKTGGALAHLK